MPCNYRKFDANYATDKLQSKIDTVKELKSVTKDLERTAPTKQQRAYFRGVRTAFDATIRGLERFGYEQTVEEITAKLKPDATANFERLHALRILDDTFYYNAGKIRGYEDVIDILSPFITDFQELWASEDNDDEIEIDINVITPKEAKLNIWIPLMVGFLGGTFATIIGNIGSELWLKNKGHIRKVEIKTHQDDE